MHQTKSLIFALFLIFLSMHGLMAQQQKPCSQPEASQFDFWLGEWDLQWQGGEGSNSITKILDGCVVEENFDGTPSMKLRGRSVSTYNAQSGKWQQTWVDNQGGYLDFSGGMVDDKMILSRQAVVKGKTVQQRMVWYNIHSDSLTWNWERSDDDGATWKVLWKIHYKRKQ